MSSESQWAFEPARSTPAPDPQVGKDWHPTTSYQPPPYATDQAASNAVHDYGADMTREPGGRNSRTYEFSLTDAANFDQPPNLAAAVEVSPSLAPALSRLRQEIQHFLSDQVTPIRLASHLAVLAVAAIVLVLSQVELPRWQVTLRSLPDGSQAMLDNDGNAVPLDTANPLVQSGEAMEMNEALHRAAVPFTKIQESAKTGSQVPVEERTEIQSYQVKSGDTVLGIAAQFQVKPETIQWANPALETNPDLLRVGDRLVVLPVDGALHVVESGDTLYSIAAKYKVPPEAIIDYPNNGIADLNTSLSVGKQLVIPGGTKPYIQRQVVVYSGPAPDSASKGSGSFVWPTSGSITQQYWNGHRAIDIGAWTGTPVKAADSGYVVASRTGWNGGYGNMVMVDHGNGFVTLYGHLNSVYVRQGESVTTGQQVGAVGNTGNSTGPHLHFEIHYQGAQRNPFTYLP